MNCNGIIGHDRELKNLLTLKSGGDIPHSLLFTGQRGTGKRLIAEKFLASLICSGADSPCGRCSVCRQISANTYPDLIILERDDKGKIPVGNKDKLMPNSVRWLIDRLCRTSSTGHYSVIIDGVDTISETGQNALLKTIEEPYSKAYILLIAESRNGILPTILSRCVEIPFRPLKNTEITDIMKVRGIDPEGKELFVEISGGSVDIALKLLDEKIFSELMNICAAVSAYVKNGNNNMFRFSEIKAVPDNDFLLVVLINIYSYIVRNGFDSNIGLIPPEILIDQSDALKVVRILLAIKKGLGNNLNIKSFLKGFMYSLDNIDSSGFPEADFTWL